MERVPWIFFDLDDTIWDFSGNSSESLKKLYNVMPILRKLFSSLEEFTDIYHKNNSLMWDYYSKGLVSTEELKRERWRRTLATRQFEILTAVCEELDRTYLSILARGTKMKDGVKEMLERLTKRYIVGVLSNGFTNTQYEKLHYSGLERYVTRTIVSEELGINKPNKAIFDYTVKETGAIGPHLMVGDNAETDVLGAMSAGWYAIWYNPFGKDFPNVKDEVNKELLWGSVKNMSELEAAIESFMREHHS